MIAGVKFYISDLSICLVAIVWLPFVLWVLLKVTRSRRLSCWGKSLGLVVAMIVAYVIPFGDVTLNSIAMNRVCPQAGLHIYKRVEVDGYLDSRNSDESITKYGYIFAESPKSGFKNGKFEKAVTYIHWERNESGQIIRSELNHPISNFEILSNDLSLDPNERLGSKGRIYVRNRNTGEVLGEWLSFHPMHGWIDRLTLNRWFGASLPGCNGDVLAIYSNWRFEILPPRKYE